MVNVVVKVEGAPHAGGVKGPEEEREDVEAEFSGDAREASRRVCWWHLLEMLVV